LTRAGADYLTEAVADLGRQINPSIPSLDLQLAPLLERIGYCFGGRVGKGPERIPIEVDGTVVSDPKP
jgi:hypothetical protein